MRVAIARLTIALRLREEEKTKPCVLSRWCQSHSVMVSSFCCVVVVENYVLLFLLKNSKFGYNVNVNVKDNDDDDETKDDENAKIV